MVLRKIYVGLSAQKDVLSLFMVLEAIFLFILNISWFSADSLTLYDDHKNSQV
jgi:hypothetical protein